jgi:hypothetical protein
MGPGPVPIKAQSTHGIQGFQEELLMLGLDGPARSVMCSMNRTPSKEKPDP